MVYFMMVWFNGLLLECGFKWFRIMVYFCGLNCIEIRFDDGRCMVCYWLFVGKMGIECCIVEKWIGFYVRIGKYYGVLGFCIVKWKLCF